MKPFVGRKKVTMMLRLLFAADHGLRPKLILGRDFWDKVRDDTEAYQVLLCWKLRCQSLSPHWTRRKLEDGQVAVDLGEDHSR